MTDVPRWNSRAGCVASVGENGIVQRLRGGLEGKRIVERHRQRWEQNNNNNNNNNNLGLKDTEQKTCNKLIWLRVVKSCGLLCKRR